MFARLLISILFIATTVSAQLKVAEFRAPGATGMKSNVDVTEPSASDLYFAKNLSFDDVAGLLRKRPGIKTVADTASAWQYEVYGATGFFDARFGFKAWFGYIPIDDDDSMKQFIDIADAGTECTYSGTTYKLGGTGLKRLVMSDTFALTLDSTSPTQETFATGFGKNHMRFTPATGYSDFLAYRDMLLIADPFALPTIFTFFTGTDNVDTTVDDPTYGPRLLPLGLEAPGQIKATLLDRPGESTYLLNGDFEYTYLYQNYQDSAGGAGPCAQIANEFGDTAIHSIVVSPRNQQVMLTGFMPRPYRLQDTIISGDNEGEMPETYVRIIRKVAGASEGPDVWRNVQDGWFDHERSLMVLDSGQNTNFGVLPTPTAGIAQPGALIYDQGDTANAFANAEADSLLPYRDTLYEIAYSWYDPITGIESALGPSLITELADTLAGGTNLMQNIFAAGYWVVDEHTPTRWMRIYQKVYQGGIVGAGRDVWYGMYQIKADHNIAAARGKWVYGGILPDSSIALGSFFGDRGVTAKYGLTKANEMFDVDGLPIIRPPHKGTVPIMFADMEYANGRLWGIGDVLFPTRLYYGLYESLDDWSSVQFVELSQGDNDKLVGLEKLGAEPISDILYIFKHNSILQMSGVDPEYDASFSTITNVGAVSRRSIINDGERIYFMSPTLRIYSMSRDGLQELSRGVENWVDSIFTDYVTAQKNVRALLLTDKVCWVDTSSANVLVWHKRGRGWTIETYDASMRPEGSFAYDTSSTTSGFSDNSLFIFQKDSAEALRVQYGSSVDSTDTTFSFPIEAQTPFIGDGENWLEIQKVQATILGTANDTIVAIVYNQDSDSLCFGYIVIDSRNNGAYIKGFPSHVGKYLSVKLRTLNGQGQLTVRDIKLYYREVGNANFK